MSANPPKVWNAIETSKDNPAVLVLTDGDQSHTAITLPHVFVPPRLRAKARELVDQKLAAYRAIPIILATTGKSDRHNRPYADLETGDQIGLVEVLVTAGALLAMPLSDTPDQLMQAMQNARSANRGLWQEPDLVPEKWRVEQPYGGRFHVLRGRVATVGVRKSRFYLNFGRYWREDLTAVVGRPLADTWRFGSRTLAQLEGACLLVMGWVDDRDGPYVALQKINQINILKDYECDAK